MKYLIILLIALFQSTLSNANRFARSSNISRIKWKTTTKLHCKSFKCPPIPDPICVRVRSKKASKKAKIKDMYMVLLNKCEMEYMKCHQGFQAAVVSLKSCGYHEKLLGRLGKERPKRSVRQGFRMPVGKGSSNSAESDKTDIQDALVDDTTEIIQAEMDDNIEISKTELDDNVEIVNTDTDGNAEILKTEIGENSEIIKTELEKQLSQSATEDETNEKKSIEIQENRIKIIEIKKFQNNNQSSIEKDKNDNQSELDKEEVDKAVAVEKDNHDKHSEVEQAKDKQTEVEKDNDDKQSDSKQDKNDIETETHSNDKKSDVENVKINENGMEEDKKKDNGGLQTIIDYDLKAANEGVDFEEYEKDCPSLCPAREVMICARCRDGIYRTFMSVCHLRMFNCAHPNEKAELVSRYPCVLSAPYLAEAPSPKGRVAEPGDVDQVLRFIRCREKEELGRGNPRCYFGQEKTTKKNKKKLK